jgi:DNA-binding Lrp family transcriptional regulator
MRTYFLVQTVSGRAPDVARHVAALERVTSAEVVTGPYDLMVQAEAPHTDALAQEVGAQIESIPGVIRSIACPRSGHDIWEMGRVHALAGTWQS